MKRYNNNNRPSPYLKPFVIVKVSDFVDFNSELESAKVSLQEHIIRT